MYNTSESLHTQYYFNRLLTTCVCSRYPKLTSSRMHSLGVTRLTTLTPSPSTNNCRPSQHQTHTLPTSQLHEMSFKWAGSNRKTAPSTQPTMYWFERMESRLKLREWLGWRVMASAPVNLWGRGREGVLCNSHNVVRISLIWTSEIQYRGHFLHHKGVQIRKVK